MYDTHSYGLTNIIAINFLTTSIRRRRCRYSCCLFSSCKVPAPKEMTVSIVREEKKENPIEITRDLIQTVG